MNPVQRAARLLIWMISAGLVAVGGLNVALQLLQQRAHPADFSVVRCALWSVAVVIGGMLLFAAPAIARQLTRDFDDD